jgi:GTPase SAR1 family protein
MHFCPKVPVMLVGCKKDLRRDNSTIESLRRQNQRPITPEQVSLLATPLAPLVLASTFNPTRPAGAPALRLLHLRHAK